MWKRWIWMFLALWVFLQPQTVAAKEYSAEELYTYAQAVLDAQGGAEAIAGRTDGDPVNDWLMIGATGLGLQNGNAVYRGQLEQRVSDMYRQNLARVQATEWHRRIVAATACGASTVMAGHDLVSDGIYNRALVASLGKQGVTGDAWALMALDASGREVPAGACDNRSAILQMIIQSQHADGSFSLMGAGDVDVTAMAVQALAPYVAYAGEFYAADGRVTVETVVNRAVTWLSAVQDEKGAFASYGTANAESCAQVIIMLTALGVDPQKDARFLKNGRSAVDALLDFRTDKGSFAHIGNTVPNGLASAQALLALTAVVRQKNGQGDVYRRSGAPVVAYLQKEAAATAEAETTAATEKATTEKATTEKATETVAGTDRTEAATTTEAVPQESSAEESRVPEKETEAVPAETTVADETKESHSVAEEPTELPVTTEGRTEPTKPSEEATETATESLAEGTLADSTDSTVPEETSSAEVAASGVAATEEETEPAVETKKPESVKGWLTAGLVLVAAALVALGGWKKRLRRVAWTLAAVSLLAAGLLQLKIQSVEEYYGETSAEGATIQIEITCKTAVEKRDELPEGLQKDGVLPADGLILKSDIAWKEGMTAFDVLQEAARQNRIPLEYKGSESTAYIQGIQYLYEFDAGPLSGWMFRVNDVFPGVSCGEYAVKAGDSVVFAYTCDLGRDIGNIFEEEE